MKKQKNFFIQIILFIVILAAITISIRFLFTGESQAINAVQPVTLNEKELVDTINNQKVEKIYVSPENSIYKISGSYPTTAENGSEIVQPFTANLPQSGDSFQNVLNVVNEKNIDIITQEATSTDYSSLILNIVLIASVIGLIMYMFSKLSARGGAGGVGGNKARLSINSDTKFTDVLGYEEEKHELYEIIDFLKNPKKYDDIGAKIPNGVLLEGPPGTGKTLIAKAVAGEVGIPFYFISGSDFIEMYVGVGASRVRSLFKEAKKQEKAIIFIDEIDAIGSRESTVNGRNSEQEQTINQLLVELDGFATSKGGIIIIAATNRADKLDPALLRSGRFDRKIVVNLPELKERELILKFHANKRTYDETIDFKELAKMTTGMSGAELEAVTNEAAILAVREKRNKFTYNDVAEAIDRVLMGPAKYSNKYNEFDKKVVSYHESGHAIAGLNVKYSNKVQKITIVPRRNAGGYVSYTPNEENQKTYSLKQLNAQLVSLLAGRAAEEIFVGSITQGAHNDFERATGIARAIVTRYGMTELGLYQYESDRYLEGYEQRSFSNKYNVLIDEKVNEILTKYYKEAKELLIKKSDDMHLLANAIQEYETLDRVDIDNLLKNRSLDKTKEDFEPAKA